MKTILYKLIGLILIGYLSISILFSLAIQGNDLKSDKFDYKAFSQFGKWTMFTGHTQFYVSYIVETYSYGGIASVNLIKVIGTNSSNKLLRHESLNFYSSKQAQINLLQAVCELHPISRVSLKAKFTPKWIVWRPVNMKSNQEKILKVMDCE